MRRAGSNIVAFRRRRPAGGFSKSLSRDKRPTAGKRSGGMSGVRRQSRLFASLILVLTMAGSAGLYFGTGSAGLREREGGMVSGRARAVDGDTIAIGATRVRIWGIAAPEYYESKGQAASRAMHRFVGGRRVDCRPLDTDRYGRIVARCAVGGRDVGALMVASGLARDCPGYSRGHYGSLEKPASLLLPFPNYCLPR